VIEIRDLRTDELGFLREMLVAALTWQPEVELPPAEWLLAHPQVVIFHEDWGRTGDTAIVAEVDGRLTGLVWYRLFTKDRHGEGYLDDTTPELAIAVVEGSRGLGIGRRLLDAAHERARRDGFPRLSLSVDPANPARRLYARAGYEPVNDDGLMVLDLT